MKDTRELMKVGDKSLILVDYESGRHEYVVGSYYDANAEIGSRWVWGHYFGTDLTAAVNYINE